MDNIVPTPAEFIFLARLYCARKQGYDLSTASPPDFERLESKDLIKVTYPHTLLNPTSDYEFHLDNAGVDFFLLWGKKLLTYSISTAIAIAGIISAIA